MPDFELYTENTPELANANAAQAEAVQTTSPVTPGTSSAVLTPALRSTVPGKTVASASGRSTPETFRPQPNVTSASTQTRTR